MVCLNCTILHEFFVFVLQYSEGVYIKFIFPVCWSFKKLLNQINYNQKKIYTAVYIPTCSSPSPVCWRWLPGCCLVGLWWICSCTDHKQHFLTMLLLAFELLTPQPIDYVLHVNTFKWDICICTYVQLV